MKILLAIALAMILSLVITVPVFADQPLDPGMFGQAVSGEAQNENGPGLSPEVFETQSEADGYDTTMGQMVKLMLDYCGIPPQHAP